MFKLLTEEAKLKVSREYRTRHTSVILMALIAMLVIGLVGIFPSFVLSSARKLELVERVRVMNGNPPSEDEPDTSAWLALINQKLKTLSPEADNVRPSDFIEKVLEKKLAGIRLTSFVWSEDNAKSALSISGIARDRQTLLSFEEALKSSVYFSNVALPVSNLAKDKDINFQLKLDLAKTP